MDENVKMIFYEKNRWSLFVIDKQIQLKESLHVERIEIIEGSLRVGADRIAFLPIFIYIFFLVCLRIFFGRNVANHKGEVCQIMMAKII